MANLVDSLVRMTTQPDHAPVAARQPKPRIHHGHEFDDPYEWLREKENPAVIAHLNAENDWYRARTSHLSGLTDEVFAEIKEHTKESDLTVPVRRGKHWYYSRSIEGKDYGVSCRAPIRSEDDWTPPATDEPIAGEEVFFDQNVEAEGEEFFSLGLFAISRDERYLAYSVDRAGDERYELRVRDLESGKDLPDSIPNTFADGAITLDGRYLFYVTVDDAWRPDTVWRHEVGTPIENDVRVFHEPDERFWVGVGIPRSGRFLEIVAGSKITTDVRLIPMDAPTTDPVAVQPREPGVEYSVDHAILGGRDVLLVLHNRDHENFSLSVRQVRFDGESIDIGEESAAISGNDRIRLESVDPFEKLFAVEYREGGIARIGTIDAAAAASGDWTVRPIEFDEEVYTAYFSGNPEWSQPKLRLAYSSLTTPTRILDWSPETGQSVLLKETPVEGAFDASNYRAERRWVTGHDGVKIPVSLVYRTDLVRLGETPAPTLLYGYGSYEASIDPTFSIPRLSLLDRGVVFAIAHVRGGGEMGRAWYENGKTLTKKNTFLDFVSAAKDLVAAGISEPRTLVAEGGSAGGLLMGAVANLAPELFAGIHAGVPFVDALTSILDPSLPLTAVEWDEWGNPLDDPEVYEYMRSYSPYENVRSDTRYPKILATTSLNDTRVLYVEPAKWVARLREENVDVLMRIEMVAGHGGVSGRYAAWRERAEEIAWILDVMEIGERAARASG